MKSALLAFALLLPAAPPASASSTDTFVSVERDAVLNFDPAAMYDIRSVSLALNIYEPLVVYSTDTEKTLYTPFLAAEVPTLANGLLSPDGRTYIFPIRKGVLFHDGTELTAEDVRYSLLRFMLSDFQGGPSPILLQPILGVPSTRDRKGRLRVGYQAAAAAVTVEGDRVRIRLRKPDAAFLDVLASWPLVMSRKWAASQGEWDGSEATWRQFNNRAQEQTRIRFAADGTGPFRLDRQDSSKGLVVLERHERYWRGPAPLRRLIFREIGCEMLRLSMLEAGDADYAELSRSSLRDAKEVAEVKIEDGLPAWSVGQAFFFNFKTAVQDNVSLRSGRLDGKGAPPDFFADRHVRQGFAYAFNYEVFRSQALRGKGLRAAGPIPFAMFGRQAPVPAYSYDHAKAVEHFKKAWLGRLWKKGFQMEIGYEATSPEAQVAVDILAAELKTINPDFLLLPKPLPKSSLFKAIHRGQLPIFVGSFEPDFPDPHSYAFSLLHSAGFGPQSQGFSNRLIDALVEKARSADDKRREALYRDLQRLYDQELPQLYLYYPVAFKALRQNVSGLDASLWLGPFSLHNALYFYHIRKN